MKKRLVLLITLVVSLFIYSDRVDASQVMYMECDDGFSEFLGMFTVDEGDAKFQVVENSFLRDKDECWINDIRFLDENCNDFGVKRDFNINNARCPEKMRLEKYHQLRNTISPSDVVFAGELVDPLVISTLFKNEYVFIQRNSDEKVFAESYYSKNGTYSHINNFMFGAYYQVGRAVDNLTYYKGSKKVIYDKDFWKVAQDNEKTYAYINCSRKEKDCIFERDYTVLFDSSEKKSELENKINEWMKNNEIDLFNNGGYNNFLSIVNDSNFLSAIDKMIESYEKSESYDFNNGYSAIQMYNKLNDSYNYLKSIYDNPIKFIDYNESGKYLTDPVESALQFTIFEFTGKVSLDEYCEIDDNECLNIPFLYKALYDDVRDYINSKKNYATSEITVLDLGNLGKLDEYTSKFLTAIAYLNKYSDSTDLDITIKENDLPKLKDNMADLGRTRNIYVVIDCDDLFSDEVKDRINHYYNIFKILISLLLIVFGLLDFGKAVFESDDNKMKESQSKFLKRIIIVIILFLVPLFVKFILSIANAVWSNIYPGACGLF